MNAFINLKKAPLILSSVLVYVAVFIFGPVMSVYAVNTQPIPQSKWLDQERVATLIKCVARDGTNSGTNNRYYGVEYTLNKSNAATGDVWGGNSEYESRELQVTKFYQSDNRIRCQSVTINALKALDMSLEDYIEKYYNGPNDDGNYTIKDGVTDTTIKNELLVLAYQKGFAVPPGIFLADPAYIRAAYKEAFDQCYQKYKTTGIDKDVGDPDATLYDGSKWNHKPGQDNKSDKAVGFIVDPSDGVKSCGEIATDLKAKDLWDIVFGTIVEEANEDDKILKMTELFLKDDASKAKLRDCVGSTPGLSSFSIVELANIIATWLSKGGTGGIPYGGNSSGGQETSAAVAEEIKKCLLGEDAFSDELLKIVEQEPPSEEIPGGTEEDPDKPVIDCEDLSLGWNPKNWLPNALDWFGCQVAKGALSLLKFASNWLADNLETTATTSSTGASASEADTALKSVWSRILQIANVLFVISFLIMILSSILDLGFVDAYTIKKFLPRLILAVIAANLSWFITSQAIELTNLLGRAMSEIILSPLDNVSGTGDAFNGSVGASLIALITAGAIPAITAVVSGGIFVFVPAVLALLFAAVTAIVVIMVRKVLIFALIVFAPVALALWAIPGMEKWAKRWWKLFIEMLMIFPFIMAMFAIGEFAAMLTLATAGDDKKNPVPGLMAIAFLCIPLFLLPTVFKMASSTLGNITGMINDRGKGLIDKGSNAARQRAGTTKRAQEKGIRRELGVADRKRGAGDRIIGSPRTRWGSIQAAATRGRLGKPIGEADVEVLKAQKAQEDVRAQSAREAQYAAQSKAGSLAMDEGYIDDASNVFQDASGAKLPGKREALAAIARGEEVKAINGAGVERIFKDGTNASGQKNFMAKGAAYRLAGQGDVDGLRMLRNDANTLMASSNPDQAIREAEQKRGVELSQNVTDAIATNPSPVLEKAPDLIKPANAAFGTSMSAGAMKKFSASTVVAARGYADQQKAAGNPSAERAFVTSVVDLVNTPDHYADLTASTAEALYHQLNGRPAVAADPTTGTKAVPAITPIASVDPAILTKLRSKF